MVVVATTDATESQVFSVAFDGSIEAVTETPGVHGAEAGGDVVVVTTATLDTDGTTTTVYRDREAAGHARFERLVLCAGIPRFTSCARASSLNTAVLLPTGDTGDQPLPVLLDPYGGPHALRVQKARVPIPGLAVVRRPGFRGSDRRRSGHTRPRTRVGARGPRRSGPAGARRSDQRRSKLRRRPTRVSISARVAIRGWSFGGFLAALAVLRRPDVFGAAVAGAPVTDWRLYDTFYTERYLGHPDSEPENYDRSSLVT